MARGAAGRLALAAAVLSCALSVGCLSPPPPPTVVHVYPLEEEVERINTAAYPEGSYRVLPGDTPRRVAARLGVDFAVFAAANGLDETSGLTAGDLLTVPKVALRVQGPVAAGGETAFASGGAVRAPQSPEKPRVGPDGSLLAISAGRVTAVFRGYISLGDVVIIENDRERVVYSGSFEPTVRKGQSVSAGAAIAVGADAASVKARVFKK